MLHIFIVVTILPLQLSNLKKLQSIWNRCCSRATGAIFLKSQEVLSEPFRDKETRDWIDQQRGVEYAKRDDKKAMLRDVFGIRSIEDRQRYQDRNAWIDEQIRKGREEEEEKANQFSPLTQQERRSTLSDENFKLRDIWDDA